MLGPVDQKRSSALARRHEQPHAPKRIIAAGSGTIPGGPFRSLGQHNVAESVDRLIPARDVSGGPPLPETLLEGLFVLHEQTTAAEPNASGRLNARTGSHM